MPRGRQLDLRTGRPVWSAYRAPRVPVERLARDVKTDVLVVGMGISGAMVAETLTAAGHAVLAIDRRGPVLGSTAATTALVQFEIDQPLLALSAAIGRDAAEAAWRRSRLAVGNLAARIAELGIRCDLERRRSLYLAGDVLGPAELREEAARRRAAGIGAHYLTRGELREAYGLARDGAILSHDNLALDPRKLTAGLWRAAAPAARGCYAPVEAIAFTHRSDGGRGGDGGRAGDLGRACGARHRLRARPDRPRRGARGDLDLGDRHAAAAAAPLAACGDDLGSVRSPYLYLRATTDGRVICGGEDEAFADEASRDALIPAKTARDRARS